MVYNPLIYFLVVVLRELLFLLKFGDVEVRHHCIELMDMRDLNRSVLVVIVLFELSFYFFRNELIVSSASITDGP